MELSLRTFFWAVQILGFLMPPLILFVLIGKQKERRKRAAVLSLVLLAVMLISAAAMTLRPPIINAAAPREALSADDKAAIRYVSRGIYSANVPIFPMAAIVTEHTDDLLRWRTCYAFWGSVEHIYDINAGMYECTDPLTGW
ncbi:MAG: hypothetical protein E7632_02665 [Ruminococcaceae bacterium]|nr:hypothetical protein [Oscillospiraceae bacterium]